MVVAVASALAVCKPASVAAISFGMMPLFVNSYIIFAVAILSRLASVNAPKLLVCPVARATLPSSASSPRPAISIAVPLGVSAVSAPFQASAAPHRLIAFGIVKMSRVATSGLSSGERSCFIAKL